MVAENSTATVKRKPRGKPFQKGQSANPGGRPAVAREFRERCRVFMEQPDGGWDALIGIAQDARSKDRRPALELIAAYAYGKPSQHLEHTGADGKALDITVRVVRS